MTEGEKDKFLLKLEWIIGITGCSSFLIIVFIASYFDMPKDYRVILIVLSSIMFAITVGYSLKIEQIAGFYECGKCHHKYVPEYSKMLWAPHYGRTRYMMCPKCNEKSWNKKVLK